MSAGWKVRGYDIGPLIGRGASGEVRRARVHGSGDVVALKRLSLTDDLQRRRARAEAAVLTVLDHPNLVRLHDVVMTDDAAVLVLDLADGGSLADLLAGRGRLTPPEVITVVAPVAAALAYVHRSGVVHGDVTPANILFTPGGVALLADLGVSRLTGDDADAESTPAYIDPAVAAGSVPGPASDVFMLGAVALHALTGAAPWTGPDATSALVAARAGDRGDPGDIAARLARAGVPDAMAAVVGRALVVDPQRRCTAAELALDLRHSGTPVAVELSAGLGRAGIDGADVDTDGTCGADLARYGRTTPRAIQGPVDGYGPRHAAAVPTSAARSRVAPAGAPPPTHAVARPRPAVPPRRRTPRVGRRHAVAACALLVVLAGGAAAMAVARPGAEPTSGAREPVSTSTPVTTPTPTPTPTPHATPDWAAELRGLDKVRARAYATGDAALLRRVYPPGPLLTADTAQLRRLVPAGCGLVGATTHYEHVVVHRVRGRAVVVARARIPASVLRCPGRSDRPTDAVATATVRLEISTTAAGPRIVQQGVV